MVHHALKASEATWQMTRLIQCQYDCNEFHGLRAIAIIDLANGRMRPVNSMLTLTTLASSGNID